MILGWIMIGCWVKSSVLFVLTEVSHFHFSENLVVFYTFFTVNEAMWFHVLSCSLWSIIRHIQHANIRTQSLLSTKNFDKICNVCEGSVLCVPSSYILQSIVQLMHYSAFHYWMSKDRSKKKKHTKLAKFTTIVEKNCELSTEPWGF